MGDSYQFNDIEVFYSGGQGAPRISVTGGPVRIDDIRKTYGPDNLYEDPDFPADDSSLGELTGDLAQGSNRRAEVNLTWLRPKELVSGEKPEFATSQNPSLSQYKASEFDITQGNLGDCWYVCSLAALTGRPEKLAVVVPEDNYTGFENGNYCGAFHFRFYDMDSCKWVDVVVDDRLPSVKIEGRYSTAFANTYTSAGSKEFWVPLLENSFAKYFGNYHRIEYGMPHQAFEYMTGGFGQLVPLKKEMGLGSYLDQVGELTGQEPPPEDFIKRQLLAYKRDGAFITIGTPVQELADRLGILEAYTDWGKDVYGFKKIGDGQYVPDPDTMGLGLCPGHAYTVLDAIDIPKKDGSGNIFLLKVKNPHHCHEWFGKYKDRDDASWNELSIDLRVREGSDVQDDGVFWISFPDVMKYFMDIEYCQFSMDDTKLTFIQGVWPKELQDQDLHVEPESDFIKYPIYKFEAQQVITKQLAVEKGVDFKECIVCIQLILNGYHPKQLPKFTYFLYKVTEEDLKGPLVEILGNRTANVYGKFGNIGKEASGWEHVSPGTYILVPALQTARKEDFGPEIAGKDIGFTIRLFTENETKLDRIA